MMTSLTWRTWSTRVEILAVEPALLPDAEPIARTFLDQVDRVASRFKADTELSVLNAASATEALDARVSPLLRAMLQAALRTAALTEGVVTPTIGDALVAAGYDRDISQLRALDSPVTHSPPALAAPDYRAIQVQGTRLTLPRGIRLDLGASAKAWAADVLASDLADTLGCGFLVNLGGDIAVAGHAPREGWRMGVEDHAGVVRQTVQTRHLALATSSTQGRRWSTSAGEAHHIIDPRTGRPAEPVWSQVTCVAATALEANAASTAAVILGARAPQWLSERGIAALLIAPVGETRTPGWPEQHEGGAAA